ncbi:YdbH domain-containing protein [Henriciella sp.]|uniref:intermembrane phospholipid transport protein YdbH family protein n=1 Tax=Henriciella sp. TaxID=1968823 RepID=UPI0026115070|nr:YdbH domain-containing protein [Henriciella sp.]
MFIVLAVLMAWIFRLQLAGWGAQQWCRANSLECELDVTALDLSGLEVSGLALTNEAQETPLQVQDATVKWRWDGFFSPTVTVIELDRPILRGRYAPDRERQIAFGGLESLSGNGGGSTPSPDLSVKNATVELETPAGPLALNGAFSGNLPYEGRFKADISPTELTSGSNRLVVQEGMADITFDGLRIDGEARLQLSEAAFEGLSARNVRATADISGMLLSQINWAVDLESFQYGDTLIEGLDISGAVKPRTLGTDADKGWLAGIKNAEATGSLENITTPAISTGPSTLGLDLERTGPDRIRMEIALTGEAVTHAHGSVGRLTVSGTAFTDNATTTTTLNGDVVADDASLSPDTRDALLSVLRSGPPLEQHAEALQVWLGDSLGSLSFGSGFMARFAAPSDWSVNSERSLSLKAANGASLMLEPHETRPALNVEPGRVELSGVLNLAGGGAPDVTAHIKSARFESEEPAVIHAGGISLKPWTASGLTFAADLNELSLTARNGTPRLQTVGELRLDGPLYGISVKEARLFGGIDAMLDSSGIRAQTFQTKCLGVDISGLSLNGGYSIGETAFQLCPVDGRVVRQSNGVAGGRIDLGSLTLPFTGQDTRGELALESAQLDWQAGESAKLAIQADAVRLPLEIGGDQLNVASTQAAFTLRSGRPASLSAQAGLTELSGSILPADVSLNGVDLGLKFTENGLAGDGVAEVQMRDPGDDPLYVPLRGDLSASLANGRMTLQGPVTTARANQTIANIDLNLDLATLDGDAQVTSETLVFSPDSLQPTALSERVRGLLSNARGELAAEASFTIDGGTPEGKGWISVSGFGFDTLRLGAVTDVTGRLEFSDILALTTPPGQEIRIGQINPGIPLENGVISFQILEGQEAIIERARWPFAGGELVVGQSDWTISGTSDTIRISAESLELSQIINIFNLPDISATGTVSGEFPVEIDGPNAYIRNATLKADETGGKVAYTGEIAEAASQADQRVRMAFNALRDFRFSVLELGANGNLSGDMLVTLKLIGTSPEVLDGAPFAFNIGVDSKLMQLVQTGRSVTTSNWLVDAVRKSASGANREAPDEEEKRE